MKDEPFPFKDNGDGTTSDNCTGLMWEKRDDAGGIHDVVNRYSWAGCCDGDCGSYPNYLGCQPNAAAAAACSAQTGGAVGCSQCSVGTCKVNPLGYEAITTIWDWLVQVNAEGGVGFAGHSDWQLPSEEGCISCWEPYRCPCGPAELESILLTPYTSPSPCRTSPCIDPIFGLTASWYYWSGSTNYPAYPNEAFFVHFGHGGAGIWHKGSGTHVRAVRGGSPSGAFLDVATAALD